MRIKSLRFRMILLFSIIITISISVSGGISYYNYYNTNKAESISYTTAIVEGVTQNLDTYLEEMALSIKAFSVDDAIVSSFKNYYTNTDYVNLTNAKVINDKISNLISLRPDIDSILFFNPKIVFKNMDYSNRSLNLNSPFLQGIWKSAATYSKMKVTYYGVNYQDYYIGLGGRNKVISVAYPIRDNDRLSSSNYGVTLMDFSFKRIDDIIKTIKLNQKFEAFILDENKNKIYSSDENFRYFNSVKVSSFKDIYDKEAGSDILKLDGRNYLMTFSTSKINGWKVVFLIDLSELKNKFNIILNSTLIIVVISILISIIMSTIISLKQTKPINKLVKGMNEIGYGNLDIRMSVEDSSYEVSSLNKGFNRMMDNIQALINEVYKTKIKQREAEFDALQAKINPHFLNNILQSITSLAILERTQEIEKLTVSFGNLLEYLIYEQNEMVTIETEIEYVRNYLTVQSIRYNNSLQIEIQMEDEIKKNYIMKLLIQPLVENCIYHGFNKGFDGGSVKIIGRKVEDRIFIDVIDNGVGMNEEELKTLNSKLELSDINENSKSIGLTNIQGRIKLKFGSEFEIKIFSIPKEGTRVQMIIPAITSKKAEDKI
jgi:two-component system, sensor histidine kinase YesM